MKHRGFIIEPHPFDGYLWGYHEEYEVTDEGDHIYRSHPTFEGDTEAEIVEQIDEWYDEEEAKR